jgi:hypothetical protein
VPDRLRTTQQTDASPNLINAVSMTLLRADFRRSVTACSVVCTENPIRVDDVMESPKLAE